MLQGRVEERYGGPVRRLRAVLGSVSAAALGAVLLSGPASAAAEQAWAWPLAGEPPVGRAFDPPDVRYAAGHRGADLVGSEGAAVLAAGAGRVGYAGLLAGRGVVVVVHGELRTTYEPVVAEVAVGSAVAAGERIGTLEPGHAGCPAAACLHWGLRRGDSYLDPLRLVDRGPVRLLPLDPRSGSVAAAAPAPPAAPRAPVPAEPVARAPLQPAAPQDTRWSLRRADAPLGAGALAALVAGLALVASARRPPRRPPDGPAAAGAVARPSLPDGDSPGPPVEPAPVPGQPTSRDAPVDLDSERARRRAAS